MDNKEIFGLTTKLQRLEEENLRLKLDILKQKSQIDELTNHLSIISDEMDSISNQNILLQTKLDQLFSKSKSSLGFLQQYLQKIQQKSESFVLD